MIRQILIYILLCFSLTAVAQQDPVLMRINGKDVLRSEFEHFCGKNNKLVKTGPKTQKDCVDMFVNSKLKVVAAEAVGMDTTRVFQTKLEAYRNQLIKSYLTDDETTERMARRYYEKMKANRLAGQVLVSHIYKSIPQNVSGSKLRQIEVRMDSIYGALKNEGANTNFDAYVKRFSDEKKTFWVSWLQMPAEFEETVFGMQVGDISHPFLTPQGVHIVKVLAKKEVPAFEEVKDEIIRRQTRHHGMDKGTEALVEKLKKNYRYSLDKAALDELISKGQTSRTLFTLEGKAYTGKDFARFAAAHPEGIQRQFAGFVMKSVLGYENEHLEQKHPDLRLLVQEYRDDLLIKEISKREIGEYGSTDKVGLTTYFNEHRSDYHWKEQRYKGIVLHCTSKRVAKQVRKFLKQLPENEWLAAIRLTFNAGATPQVQAEKGLFAPGDNLFVDDLVFKMKEASPLLSFPFTVVVGKKVKGPEEYQEVGEQLISDYQNYLERRWIAKLYAVNKVEINQEVLKTVNNH